MGSRPFVRTQAVGPRWRGWAGPEAEEAWGCWQVWADQRTHWNRFNKEDGSNKEWSSSGADLSVEPGFELIRIWVES